MGKTVIISNRLPVQLQISNGTIDAVPSVGGLATGMKSVHSGADSLWIGWSGLTAEEIPAELEGQIDLALKKHGCSKVTLSADEVEGFCRSIQEDFVNPDLLYLGTELGLFITINGGQSWSHFTNNMPPVAVHHVTLHPRDHALVMGTHGRGVIVIDDVTPFYIAKEMKKISV